MADHWQDNSIITAEVKDDDDAPADWETALDEKPEIEEKPKQVVKPASTSKSKTNKKKTTDNEDAQKLVQEPDRDYTPDELDQIQKRREIQQEQDKLDMISELVENDSEHHSLENINLVTKEEFLNYSFRLYNRLENLSKSEFYSEFIDDFLTGITKSMSIDGVKHLQATLQAVFLRKQSEEREKKAKAKTKKQVKPQLKTGRQADFGAFGDEEHDYEQEADYDDDFM